MWHCNSCLCKTSDIKHIITIISIIFDIIPNPNE